MPDELIPVLADIVLGVARRQRWQIDADDVCQDFYVKLLQIYRTIDLESASLFNYLTTVAANMLRRGFCTEKRRRQRRRFRS